MLRPTATQVKPLDNYTIEIIFNNGEQKVFDVKPYIKGSWYGELSDVAYFKSVAVNGFTVAWPNGQDLCPDELYHDSVPVTAQ